MGVRLRDDKTAWLEATLKFCDIFFFFILLFGEILNLFKVNMFKGAVAVIYNTSPLSSIFYDFNLFREINFKLSARLLSRGSPRHFFNLFEA